MKLIWDLWYYTIIFIILICWTFFILSAYSWYGLQEIFRKIYDMATSQSKRDCNRS